MSILRLILYGIPLRGKPTEPGFPDENREKWSLKGTLENILWVEIIQETMEPTERASIKGSLEGIEWEEAS